MKARILIDLSVLGLTGSILQVGDVIEVEPYSIGSGAKPSNNIFKVTGLRVVLHRKDFEFLSDNEDEYEN